MKHLGVAVCVTLAALANGQPTGSIEGQLVNRSTGAPLNKAVMTLELLSGHDTSVSTGTDEQGRFTFTDLKAGRYRLTAERRGFLRQNYGAGKYGTGAKFVGVAPNQPVNAIVFKLTPESVISGRIIDEDGEPVEGVRVAVLKPAWNGGMKEWPEAASVTTLDNGQYRIPRLVAGRYLIRCAPIKSAPRAQDTMNVTTFYPNVTEPSAAVPVEVGSGAEAGAMDIRIRRTRVFHLRGKVIPPPGGRLATAQTIVASDDGRQLIGGAGAEPPGYFFDAQEVPPGSYFIGATWVAENGQRFSASQPVLVRGSDIAGLILDLTPASEIRGTLKLEDAAAPVDLRNLAVDARPVRLVLSNDNPPGGNKVGDDLRFSLRIPAAPFVLFRVEVTHLPGNCYVKSIRYGGQDLPDGGAEIIPGAELEIAIGGDAGMVDGTALDQDGHPMPGAVVALIPKDGKTAMDTTSDEHGKFQFQAVAPGEYRLLAWEDVERGAWQDAEFVKPFDDRATVVKVSPSGRATVQLKTIPAE
jgi:protocatechuate 3,4-dioxygenase beta subunit